MRLRHGFAFGAVLLLSGCSTPPPPVATPSATATQVDTWNDFVPPDGSFSASFPYQVKLRHTEKKPGTLSDEYLAKEGVAVYFVQEITTVSPAGAVELQLADHKILLEAMIRANTGESKYELGPLQEADGNAVMAYTSVIENHPVKGMAMLTNKGHLAFLVMTGGGKDQDAARFLTSFKAGVYKEPQSSPSSKSKAR